MLHHLYPPKSLQWSEHQLAWEIELWWWVGLGHQLALYWPTPVVGWLQVGDGAEVGEGVWSWEVLAAAAAVSCPYGAEDGRKLKEGREGD